MSASPIALLRELMELKEVIEIQETVAKHTKKKMGILFMEYSKDCTYSEPIPRLGKLAMCGNNRRAKYYYLSSEKCTVDNCTYLKTL